MPFIKIQANNFPEELYSFIHNATNVPERLYILLGTMGCMPMCCSLVIRATYWSVKDRGKQTIQWITVMPWWARSIW